MLPTVVLAVSRSGDPCLRDLSGAVVGGCAVAWHEASLDQASDRWAWTPHANLPLWSAPRLDPREAV